MHIRYPRVTGLKLNGTNIGNNMSVNHSQQTETMFNVYPCTFYSHSPYLSWLSLQKTCIKNHPLRLQLASCKENTYVKIIFTIKYIVNSL